MCVLPCGPAGVTGAFTTHSCSSGCSQREFLHPGNPSPSSSLLSLQHSCCILNCVSGSCQVVFFFFLFKPPSYSFYRPVWNETVLLIATKNAAVVLFFFFSPSEQTLRLIFWTGFTRFFLLFPPSFLPSCPPAGFSGRCLRKTD